MKIKITAEKTAKIAPNMIGLFFEDISCAADGGLSAELVENRSFGHIAPDFEFYTDESGRTRERLSGSAPEPGFGWEITHGSAEYLKDEDGLYFMRLRGGEDGAAAVNTAFGGFALRRGINYNAALTADMRGYSGKIILEAVSGVKGMARCLIGENGAGVLKAESGAADCRLRLSFPDLSKGESVDIKMLSLVPSDAVFGIFRRDMAEAMKELRPGFLRFPGGCAVEGYDLKNAYRWKHTVGPAHRRKQDFSRWAFKEPGYNQSFAIGFYEYFLLCEYLDCEPLPVINAGMACQFNTSETVPLYDKNGNYTHEFAEYLNDALDLIEFANGAPDTKWGRLRSDMGHPEPFNLRMLAIGNEQWQTETNQWFERYEAFEKAIHQKYPKIDLIFSAGPRVGEERYEAAHKRLREKSAKNSAYAFAVDEHNYNTKEWFFENADFYEGRGGIPVYLGEYAAKPYEADGKTRFNDMISALSEAAFLCGLERAENVIMASYAPLFSKRPPHSHWAPDMIWFDAERIVKTPNYYVQKLFAENMGAFALACGAGDGVYAAASLTKNGDLIIKLVNPTENEIEVELNIAAELNASAEGDITVLCGDSPTAKNTFENPDNIKPKTEVFNRRAAPALKPYSLTVIKLPRK